MNGNDRLQRRDFLKGASLATISALAAGPVKLVQAGDDIDRAKRAAKADSLIILWMGGGMASSETFDPKRYTPFVKGMKAADVASTFPAKPTAVDGVLFSEG